MEITDQPRHAVTLPGIIDLECLPSLLSLFSLQQHHQRHTLLKLYKLSVKLRDYRIILPLSFVIWNHCNTPGRVDNQSMIRPTLTGNLSSL